MGRDAYAPSGIDAVVIVPGIMGSQLRDVTSGRPLWGVGTIMANTARLGYRERMRALRVTPDERAGRGGRVEADGLLSVPDWAVGLGGLEPYGDLARTVRQHSLVHDAVLDFAYDWRLSVEHNGALLARAARAHLARWRAHPVLHRYQRESGDDRVARLVFVAHSMGGLLVQAACAPGGGPLDIRAVLTLGTPFAGSVRVLELLASGTGAPVPLPTGATRDACRTMPGVYDLLPSYRCRVLGDDVVLITPDDVAAVGGDAELTQEAFARRERLARVKLPGHVAVVGTSQVTQQSVRLSDGAVTGYQFGFRRNGADELLRDACGRPLREDHGGDGTVFRYAARPGDVTETPLAQQHAALARTRSALDQVTALLTGLDELGAVLGGADAGLDMPDAVPTGRPLPIRITGTFEASRTQLVIEDTARHDRVVANPVVAGRPVDGLTLTIPLPGPGLFRVRLSAGGDPVSKLVLAGDPDDSSR
jgi:hypothetical protein